MLSDGAPWGCFSSVKGTTVTTEVVWEEMLPSRDSHVGFLDELLLTVLLQMLAEAIKTRYLHCVHVHYGQWLYFYLKKSQEMLSRLA